jgi:hypothetical protein
VSWIKDATDFAKEAISESDQEADYQTARFRLFGKANGGDFGFRDEDGDSVILTRLEDKVAVKMNGEDVGVWRGFDEKSCCFKAGTFNRHLEGFVPRQVVPALKDFLKKSRQAGAQTFFGDEDDIDERANSYPMSRIMQRTNRSKGKNNMREEVIFMPGGGNIGEQLSEIFSGRLRNEDFDDEEDEEDDKVRPDPIRNFDLKPREIVDHLNRYVVQQHDAKKVLAVAVSDHYNHCRRFLETPAAEQPSNYAKPNILLVGPTGVGKTYLIRRLQN